LQEFFLYSGGSSSIRYMVCKCLLTLYMLPVHFLDDIISSIKVFYFDSLVLIKEQSWAFGVIFKKPLPN
jgi:hypothetical protein